MPQFAPIEKKLFIAIKAQPIKFSYTDPYLAQNAYLYDTILSILNNTDEIKALLSEKMIQGLEVGIRTKRMRNPSVADHNRSMEKNILNPLYQYSEMMNLFFALETLGKPTQFNFGQMIEMIQNDCKTRIENLEQEKLRNPAINDVLRKYAADTSKIPVPLLGYVSAREYDYMCVYLMAAVLMTSLTIIFGNSAYSNIKKYSAAEITSLLDSSISTLVATYLSLYSRGGRHTFSGI